MLFRSNMNICVDFYSKFSRNLVFFYKSCENYKSESIRYIHLKRFIKLYIHIYIHIRLNKFLKDNIISLILARMWKLDTWQKIVKSHISNRSLLLTTERQSFLETYSAHPTVSPKIFVDWLRNYGACLQFIYNHKLKRTHSRLD